MHDISREAIFIRFFNEMLTKIYQYGEVIKNIANAFFPV